MRSFCATFCVVCVWLSASIASAEEVERTTGGVGFLAGPLDLGGVSFHARPCFAGGFCMR